MTDYDDVKVALGNTLTAAVDGLRVYPRLLGQINPPAAVITPNTGPFLTYGTTFDGGDDLDLAITLLVARGDDRTADEKLGAYIARSGSRSILAAVAGDRTLGGLVNEAWVTGAQDWGVITVADVAYLGCVFPVKVLL